MQNPWKMKRKLTAVCSNKKKCGEYKSKKQLYATITTKATERERERERER